MVAYIDASYATWPDDRKSHTGIALSLGCGTFYARSGRQKICTDSSTAAELVALNSGLKPAVNAKFFLELQGYKMAASDLKQENKSTIAMTKNGIGNSSATKHIEVRYFHVKNFVDRGLVSVSWIPTADMVADILTKAVTGANFERLRAILLGEQALFKGVCW